jgi:DnaK suppressor protein
MPRATKSTAKQPARGQTKSAAGTRKATAKTASKAAAGRTVKTSTARRTTATASKVARTTRAKSATPPPPKTAARSKSAAKTVKATKTPAKAAAKPPTAKQHTAKTPVTKSPAAKPVKVPAKKALTAQDKKFLAEQRELLLTERETYTKQATNLKAEADQLAEEMEPGDIQFDEESGEGGTMNVERERDLALSAQSQAAVEEIDQALVKIDDGSYGYCEQCGQPIPKARLKALPYAALCVACKSGGLSRR